MLNAAPPPPSTSIRPSPAPDLADCRRGTAALEFALVAPIIALLAMGLADSVRRTLARIDLEAATNAGARAALAGRPV